MAVVLIFMVAPSPARGQISPGRLSRPHARLDGSGRCLDCHSSGRGVDAGRCLACHQELAGRITAGRGLHARSDHRACERCHIEHQGASFELIWWGEAGMAAFDHRLAGHPLEGAHAALACRSCHRAEKIAGRARLEAQGIDPARTFLGLARACAACHQDPHRGQFESRDCTSCHGQQSWKPAAGFDHAGTAFPLTGRHRGLDCARCHATATVAGGPAVRWRGVATGCKSCHQDPHANRFGPRCESCHGTESWQRIDTGSFDHSRTRYPLLGKHRVVACEDCHAAGKPRQMAGFERCATCHADPHGGQLTSRADGGECGACHSEKGFRPSTFDLADHRATTYPLEGAHAKVACGACHTPQSPAALQAAGVALRFAGTPPATLQRFRFTSTRCPDCHRDPHAGETAKVEDETGCLSCHALASWREVRFDHARTGFLLEGAHRAPPCRDCHPAGETATGATELRFAGAARECAGCHQDPHAGQFTLTASPKQCTACHGLETWRAVGFLHDRDSSFRLEGAHRAVACQGCHPVETRDGRRVVRYRPLAATCADCHAPGAPP
ncbi:MAG TPA: hypothetical protein VF017_12245 [Thermoanaerobaculia bacterium]|nr:hypothetical protein [Thermoanaerobaculia bacterium]